MTINVYNVLYKKRESVQWPTSGGHSYDNSFLFLHFDRERSSRTIKTDKFLEEFISRLKIKEKFSYGYIRNGVESNAFKEHLVD